MAEEESKTSTPNRDIDKLIKKVLHDKLSHYITGKVTAEITRMHYGNKLKPKVDKSVVKEEAPTNMMGNSSSTAGTGPIDTFDPLMKNKKKNLAKRKNPNGTPDSTNKQTV